MRFREEMEEATPFPSLDKKKNRIGGEKKENLLQGNHRRAAPDPTPRQAALSPVLQQKGVCNRGTIEKESKKGNPGMIP